MSSVPPPPSIVALLRVAWEGAVGEIRDGLLDAGFEGIRSAHLLVLRDVLTAELRPTELAARLGLSKQAANDVLREYEAGGYIRLVPDPEDGRAKRIQGTERGMALVQAASASSGVIAGRWADRVGEERFAQFAQVLHELASSDGATGGDERPPPGA